MPSSQTANYQLSQWSKDDRVLMDDFNADNAKIDATLAAHAAALTKLPLCGNCQIYYGSYVGDGTYGESAQSSLSFDCMPLLVVVMDSNGVHTTMVRDNPAGSSSGRDFVTTFWSGNTVSWYGNYVSSQFNNSGYTYHWVALCSKG